MVFSLLFEETNCPSSEVVCFSGNIIYHQHQVKGSMKVHLFKNLVDCDLSMQDSQHPMSTLFVSFFLGNLMIII